MIKDRDNQKKADRNIVLAAIRAIKNKGWDLNPYTVADEADIPRSLIYRDPELMELIIRERGGTFGMDLDTSLNLGRQIEELEKELGELKENARQFKIKTGNTSSRLKALQSPASVQQLPSTSIKPPKNGEDHRIFNAAREEQYTSPETNSLQNLNWKDIETVYQMKVNTLVDYGRNIPTGNGETQSGWPSDDSELVYRPYAATQQSTDTNVKSFEREPFTEPTLRTDGSQALQPDLSQQIVNDWSGVTFQDVRKNKPANTGDRVDIAISPFQALKSQPSPPPLPLADVAHPKGFVNARAAAVEQDLLDQRLEARDIAEASPPPEEGVEVGNEEFDTRVPASPTVQAPIEIVNTPIPEAPSISNLMNKSAEAQSDDVAYSDFNLAGPHYSFGTAYDFNFGAKNKAAAPIPEAASNEAYVDVYAREMAEESLTQAPAVIIPPDILTMPDLQIAEAVPDLEALDIFDDLDHLTELEEIEIIEDVLKTETANSTPGDATTISGDELRELIKSRIKQAAEQLAEPPADTASAPAGEADASKKAIGRSKFVGAAKAHEPPPQPILPTRTVPADIRKACLLLGVRPEEITREIIQDAWKRQIASPGVHPDLGGDTESAIYLNTAKDTLLRWLDAQAPKLGKRFGQTVRTRAQQNPKDSAEKSEQ